MGEHYAIALISCNETIMHCISCFQIEIFFENNAAISEVVTWAAVKEVETVEVTNDILAFVAFIFSMWL